MAADWDLYAVVRSCSSVLKRDSSAVGSNRSPKGNDSGWHEDPFACLASMTNDPFPFPNPSKSGCKHEHVFTHADTTTMGTNRGMDPSFTRPDDGGSSGQHHQIQHHQQQEQPTITTSPAAPIFTFGEFGNQRQQQLQLKKRVQRQEVPRTRNRKNQNQKRTVCHVAGENLSTDQWSWRKYGQKPIKGSPNPRHYYKCSSSKGCSARKHVERSNLDPNTFIVTYTGDHIHSRPTYRNSLAGSSRRKRLLAIQKAANASSSFSSPTTPLTAPEDGAAAAANLHNAGDNGVKEGETANNVALETSTDAENDDDDDVILIPNVHVNENLFQGLGPNWPAFGGNFPSWGTGSSAAGRG